MRITLTQRFHPECPEGKAYIDFWNNKVFHAGDYSKVCNQFGLTPGQVSRLKRILNLPNVDKTPARNNLERHVRKSLWSRRATQKALAKRHKCSVSLIQKMIRGKFKLIERENDTAKSRAILENPKEFKKIWNSHVSKKGLIKKMARKFGLTYAAVQYLQRAMRMHKVGVNSKRREFERKIVYWYTKKNLSTILIAKKPGVNMTDDNIKVILKRHKVEMKPQHCTNPIYFKVKKWDGKINDLLKLIKSKYVEEHKTCAQIAKELNIDQGTVSTKLKCMGFKVLRQHHQATACGEKCQWCAIVMETAWQVNGPRKQKFCGHKCKNRAKDLRRMLTDPSRFTETRMKMMTDFLKQVWGDKYVEAIERIRKTEPCIKRGHGGSQTDRQDAIWSGEGKSDARVLAEILKEN
jgi:hypothetical protein